MTDNYRYVDLYYR